MAKVLRERQQTLKFEDGDKVKCIDVTGLPDDVTKWILLQDFHKIRKVFSKKTEPIIILESIEGHKDPKLGDNSYPFLGERFVRFT